jgi:hypothetical protein
MKDKFQINYPFLSCIRSNNKEYIGIIVNFDSNIVSIYDISMVSGEEERKFFLEMGDTWWWESNRKIPINIFLKKEMIVFRPFIKTFNAKDVDLLFGPIVNLSDIAEKRVKRKSIQLVKSVKNIRSQ